MSKPKNVTPEFRVSYPNVFRAKLNDLNGKSEYSLVALFPLGCDLTNLKNLASDALAKKFGPDKTKWPKNIRSPFRDQGERAKETDDGKRIMPSGYEDGAIMVNLKSDRRPGVVDQNVQDIIEESEFYGGCYAIASVNARAYDVKGNRGVSLYLTNVQKTRDGDPFGTRTKPQDDFAPISDASGSVDAAASASVDIFS